MKKFMNYAAFHEEERKKSKIYEWRRRQCAMASENTGCWLNGCEYFGVSGNDYHFRSVRGYELELVASNEQQEFVWDRDFGRTEFSSQAATL